MESQISSNEKYESIFTSANETNSLKSEENPKCLRYHSNCKSMSTSFEPLLSSNKSLHHHHQTSEYNRNIPRGMIVTNQHQSKTHEKITDSHNFAYLPVVCTNDQKKNVNCGGNGMKEKFNEYFMIRRPMLSPQNYPITHKGQWYRDNDQYYSNIAQQTNQKTFRCLSPVSSMFRPSQNCLNDKYDSVCPAMTGNTSLQRQVNCRSTHIGSIDAQMERNQKESTKVKEKKIKLVKMNFQLQELKQNMSELQATTISFQTEIENDFDKLRAMLKSGKLGNKETHSLEVEAAKSNESKTSTIIKSPSSEALQSRGLKLDKKENNPRSSEHSRVNDVISRLSSLNGCETSSRCSTASLSLMNHALITPESSSRVEMQPLQESECSMDSGYQDHFGVAVIGSKKSSVQSPIAEDVKKKKRQNESVSNTENILNFQNESAKGKLVLTQSPLTTSEWLTVSQLTSPSNKEEGTFKPIPKQRKSLKLSTKEFQEDLLELEDESLDQREIKLGISSIKDTKSSLQEAQDEKKSSNEVRASNERSGSQQEVIRRRSMRMMTELQIYEIDDLGETQVVQPMQKKITKSFANKKLQKLTKDQKQEKKTKNQNCRSPPTILDDLGPKIVSQSWDIYRIGSPEDLRRPQALLPQTSPSEQMIENVAPHLRTLNKSSTYTRSTNAEVEATKSASFMGASQLSAFSPVHSTSLFSINSYDQSEDKSFIRRTSLPPRCHKQQLYNQHIPPFVRNETKKEMRIKKQEINHHSVDFKHTSYTPKHHSASISNEDDYHLLNNHTNSLSVDANYHHLPNFYELKIAKSREQTNNKDLINLSQQQTEKSSEAINLFPDNFNKSTVSDPDGFYKTKNVKNRSSAASIFKGNFKTSKKIKSSDLVIDETQKQSSISSMETSRFNNNKPKIVSNKTRKDTNEKESDKKSNHLKDVYYKTTSSKPAAKFLGPMQRFRNSFRSPRNKTKQSSLSQLSAEPYENEDKRREGFEFESSSRTNLGIQAFLDNHKSNRLLQTHSCLPYEKGNVSYV